MIRRVLSIIEGWGWGKEGREHGGADGRVIGHEEEKRKGKSDKVGGENVVGEWRLVGHLGSILGGKGGWHGWLGVYSRELGGGEHTGRELRVV